MMAENDRPQEEMALTPEDDKILDDVWAKIAAEDATLPNGGDLPPFDEDEEPKQK